MSEAPVIIDIVKVFIPTVLCFGIGMLLAQVVSHYLYKYKMWKKKAGKVALDGSATAIFNELHKDKETGTPRMGGIIIWLSVLFTTAIIWTLSHVFPSDITTKLDFVSRNQTWIPLLAMFFGAFVGLLDDWYEIRGGGDHKAGGLSLTKRLLCVALISLFCGAWFYFKLDVSTVWLPWVGDLNLGLLFIPFFMIVALAIYSGGVIDGIDGLAGGVFAAIFSAYAGIAFYQSQINLAAFCAMVVGGILAFLWYNIPPARFYMSETGSMALTITLAIVAFMTDSLGEGHGVILLPIIALPLALTSLSVIIQVLSKKFRGKKIFMVAPIHHHFEAIGWPSYKVTMRYWVVAVVCAIGGMILGLL